MTDVRTDKPWGYEVLLEHNDRYAMKLIGYTKGCRTSLQSHTHKRETLLCLEGSAMLEIGESSVVLSDGLHYTIEPGVRHRVTALVDTRVIEISTPELDDIVRYEDDYGRDTVAE